MDGSESNIPNVDLDIMSTLSADINQWIGFFKAETVCKTHQEITKERLMNQSKETLANCLMKGYQTIQFHANKIELSRVSVEQLKSELIAAQRSVVKLQQQLLEAQSKQLNTVPAVVDKAVDKRIQLYTEVVSQTVKESVPVLSKQKLKKAVQEAVTDDDRSKNVVVFGLSEETSEDLDGKIATLFGEIEEKPSFHAIRIGKESEERTRPVKVSLRNSETVFQLLGKAKHLRTTEAYRKVYISPDRSPEERIKHRELVAEMKRKNDENPDQHYFISAGSIGCRDRYTSETSVTRDRQTSESSDQG
jgi:hypothetical protein